MKDAFRKRTFSFPSLLRSAAAMVVTYPYVIVGLFKPVTSAALREQVMLAVTSVNDCRYCSWAHTGLALKEGVDLEDLRRLLGHDVHTPLVRRDAVAIVYAKHFAETERRPEPEAEAALAARWNPRERREIMAYIHAIYFSNLCGNSADAWLARLRGQRVSGGHPVAESIAALLAAPVLFSLYLSHGRAEKRLAE